MRWGSLGQLAFIVTIYVLFGALLFRYFELKDKKDHQSELRKNKEAFLDKYACVDQNDLESLLSEASSLPRYQDANWDISNSVFFTVTLLTTIGYGDLAPETSGGRVFCVLYGLLGVPAVLALLAGLGSKLTTIISRLSLRIPASSTFLMILSGILMFLVIPAAVFSIVEGWTITEGLYYAFITLSTVGFGDLIAGMQAAKTYPSWYRPWRLVWLLLGLVWLFVIVNMKKDLVKAALRQTSHSSRATMKRNLSKANEEWLLKMASDDFPKRQRSPQIVSDDITIEVSPSVVFEDVDQRQRRSRSKDSIHS